MSDSTCRLTDSTFRTTSQSTNGKQLEYVRKAAGEISHHLFYHGLWVVLEEHPIVLTDSRAADFGKKRTPPTFRTRTQHHREGDRLPYPGPHEEIGERLYWPSRFLGFNTCGGAPGSAVKPYNFVMCVPSLLELTDLTVLHADERSRRGMCALCIGTCEHYSPWSTSSSFGRRLVHF